MTQLISLSRYKRPVDEFGSDRPQYEKFGQEKSLPVEIVWQTEGQLFRVRRRKAMAAGWQMWCNTLEETGKAPRCEESISADEISVSVKTPYAPVIAEERRWKYPTAFRDQFRGLLRLQDGWGGEDEIAPKKETLFKVLRFAQTVASWSNDIGGADLFPALFPGFLGQVELRYRHGKRTLRLEVSGDSHRPIAFLKTSQEQQCGHEHESGFIESLELVRPLLEWLLSE